MRYFARIEKQIEDSRPQRDLARLLHWAGPMSEVWTIVLAGGQGTRLAPMTGGVPKQFWRPEGTKSTLLGGTLGRLYPLSAPERTITIVDRTHHAYVKSLADAWLMGDVIYQPVDRGTAAGVLLPLVDVLRMDPGAIVIITPSDHGVEDALSFRKGLTQGIARMRAGLSDIVLFGVEPAMPEYDYGWIMPYAPGDMARDAFHRVASFVEKADPDQADLLFSFGAVWNTTVVVARASALLNAYRRFQPFLTDVLTTASGLDPRSAELFLLDWYPELPSADFCRDLLVQTPGLWVYTWPAEIGWSDLGTPDRMEEWAALQRALPKS